MKVHHTPADLWVLLTSDIIGKFQSKEEAVINVHKKDKMLSATWFAIAKHWNNHNVYEHTARFKIVQYFIQWRITELTK